MVNILNIILHIYLLFKLSLATMTLHFGKKFISNMRILFYNGVANNQTGKSKTYASKEFLNVDR